jgi:hypothetical protein
MLFCFSQYTPPRTTTPPLQSPIRPRTQGLVQEYR